MAAGPRLSAHQFIARWQGKSFHEDSDAQTWFLDLLRLVDHPDPVEFDDKERFTFEKKISGGKADAYLEGHFVWEFKSAEPMLKNAIQQCLRYSVHLKTPPLLIASSFQLIRIQTNFPGKETHLHEIDIKDLVKPGPLAKLRNIFFHPETFEPQRTVEKLTEETAESIGEIVAAMEQGNRNVDPERLARYLNQVIFCLYAEDTDLLPNDYFSEIVKKHYKDPSYFNDVVADLFTYMAEGGRFGRDIIPHFNGDLFNHSDTVELSDVALFHLQETVRKNWRDIDPSIFGTLFERALDASKRAQLGAHYTAAADILRVIEPVLLKPLRQEWDEVRAAAETALKRERRDDAFARLDAFRQRLATLKVLDPACGSGNFLYLALRELLDLEKAIIDFAAAHGWHDLRPTVKPDQFLGIEIDTYAAELARTALWIGYIQWHQANGFPYTHSPILTTLDTIQQRDAILTYDDKGQPSEPEWPAAEFIIGNPPFLGGRPFRGTLGDEYVKSLFGLYGKRIPNSSDLCCYWFEKARAQIESGRTRHAGLLATQGIRFQSSRQVLNRIKESGDIFAAYSDENWFLDGANVHISIICFDDGSESEHELNGKAVTNINADLTTGADLTKARRLLENQNISYFGDKKHGPFEISEQKAMAMLSQPNPHGKPNSDVIVRWMNGQDIVQKPRNMWIIDFGTEMNEEEAALYEAPFEYVKERVKPKRVNLRMRWRAENWWLHGAPAPKMRKALSGLNRYIATCRTAKHRLFTFLDGNVLPDSAVVVFALDDDYSFGILHSRYHELWARATGSQLREAESGFRYTPTTCFETFPFPRSSEAHREAIAAAAQNLNQRRENWLNPLDELGRPYMEGSAELRRRTLTNLYNKKDDDKRTWLQNCHDELDAAVAAAYGWPADLPEEEILARLLALNLERSSEGG